MKKVFKKRKVSVAPLCLFGKQLCRHMKTSTVYINAPFTRDEHDAIEALAKKQGRSKGQQIRSLALIAMGYAASAKANSKRKGAK